uniref:Serine-threonine/tyrosine-protein kinase catalytic domain-containing protein n=1 Tax=Syphacia muris TaxID=451379 RepID=A0A0N5B008_9BILA
EIAGASSSDSGIGSSGTGSKFNGANPQCSANILSNQRNNYDAEGLQRRVAEAYDALSGKDPSLEEMRRLVCEQKRRPVFNEILLNDRILAEICFKITECWDENINARPQIMSVKRSLSKAVNEWEQRKLLTSNDAYASGTTNIS